MKSVSISGTPRVGVGKKDAKAVRASGQVPCVLYGGTDQVTFSVKYNDLNPVVYTPHVNIVEINLGDKTYKALVQEIQFHPVKDRIIHIDFLEMNESKPVIIGIPVTTVGSSAGVKAGGKLVINLRKMKIKALPAHLPDTIEINVENLEIGKSVRVEEIKMDNVHFMDSPNVVVVAVKTTRNAAAAATEAAKAAPAKGAAPAKSAPAKAAPAKK